MSDTREGRIPSPPHEAVDDTGQSAHQLSQTSQGSLAPPGVPPPEDYPWPAEEEASSAVGSNTEKEAGQKMPSRSSKHHENHSSTANKTAEEWYTVTDHDERRRIQNKLAQRKFRMKAREQKERAERESRNHEHAGSSYRIPDPDALGPEDEDPSGLPWGSINMKHVVAKGHESESRRGSGNDGSHGSQYYANKGYNSQQQQQQQQQASNYGSQYSSGADDQHYPQQQQQQQHASNYSSQHSRGEYDQYYGG